jgi:hypothetical protein
MGLRPTKSEEDVDNGVGGPPAGALDVRPAFRPEAEEGVGRGPVGPPHLAECVFRGALP